MAKNDRLRRAWEMRRDVHAWIAAHPDCSMPEIKRNFGDLNPETVRWVVKRLRQEDFVSMEFHCYRVLREFDQPVDAARNRLRDGGRKSGVVQGMTNATRTRNADGTFAPIRMAVIEGVRMKASRRRHAIPLQGPFGLPAF